MTFLAGQKLRASELNAAINAVDIGIVGRNFRTTNMTGITAITRCLSCSAPITAGRTYRISVYGEVFGNAGATTIQAELRYTTNGVEPSTTDTVMCQNNMTLPSTTGVPESCSMEAIYPSAISGTLFVALTLFRVAGAVTVAFTGSAVSPTHIEIADAGPTVAVSGTVY